VGKAELKVPGGKLLRAFTTLREGRIEEVRITGDFFMHPEDALEDLEAALAGADFKALAEAVERFFAGRKVEMFGVGAEDFAEVLLKAVVQAKS